MIKFVDMFSGIGGFREGLTRAGGFECVGHCEIDKYANRSYNALFDTKGEWFIEDARKADPGTMPDFQLLCGGFPCQTYPEKQESRSLTGSPCSARISTEKLRDNILKMTPDIMLLRMKIRINIVRCIDVNKIGITFLSACVLDALSVRGLKAKTVQEFERYGTRRIVKHCLDKG